MPIIQLQQSSAERKGRPRTPVRTLPANSRWPPPQDAGNGECAWDSHHRRRQRIGAIKAELKLLGYESYLQVLSAEECGTPQMGRRVFIVASRLGDPKALIPSPTHRSGDKHRASKSETGTKPLVTVQQAIGDLPPIPNGGGEHDTPRPSSRASSIFQRTTREGTRRLFNHVCHSLTEMTLKRIVQVPEGGNWRDIPRILLPAGMRRAHLSDHTNRYGRLARKSLASTILTKCDPHWGAYIHLPRTALFQCVRLPAYRPSPIASASRASA